MSSRDMLVALFILIGRLTVCILEVMHDHSNLLD